MTSSAEIRCLHSAPISTHLESNSGNAGFSQCGKDICLLHFAMPLLRRQALKAAGSGSLPSDAPEYSRPEEKYFLQDLIGLRE